MDEAEAMDEVQEDAQSAALCAGLAQLCHEVNRAYCQAIGDDSQVPWDEAPDWQRESAEDGVRFLLTDPQLGAEDVHEQWVWARQEDGWKYGKDTDADAKTHPGLRPWAELPAREKAKDMLFCAVVRSGATVVAGLVQWMTQPGQAVAAPDGAGLPAASGRVGAKARRM